MVTQITSNICEIPQDQWVIKDKGLREELLLSKNIILLDTFSNLLELNVKKIHWRKITKFVHSCLRNHYLGGPTAGHTSTVAHSSPVDCTAVS
jgi:hypothetical protein